MVYLDIQYLASNLSESQHNTDVGPVRIETCCNVKCYIVT